MPTKVDPRKAQQILEQRWEEIQSKTEQENFVESEELQKAIENSINSNTKSYRYVLPTQLLAKVTNSSVDCVCMQKKRGGPGAFDARSFCKKTVTLFDRKNENVLGGAPDPYVNNPLRGEEVTKEYRLDKKDKEGWDILCSFLRRVEERNNPDFTDKVFNQTLLEINRRLEKTEVTYPIPSRISLKQIESLVGKYLSEPSGGARPEVITYSVFETTREELGFLREVAYSKPTASDSSMRRVADVECYDPGGNIVLVAEVKDAELEKDDVEDTVHKAREEGVSEIFFITTEGIRQSEREEIERLVKSEFESGQNIYIMTPLGLARPMLALLGENGRRNFLVTMKETLEEGGYSYKHRKKWAELLKEI